MGYYRVINIGAYRCTGSYIRSVASVQGFNFAISLVGALTDCL